MNGRTQSRNSSQKQGIKSPLVRIKFTFVAFTGSKSAAAPRRSLSYLSNYRISHIT